MKWIKRVRRCSHCNRPMEWWAKLCGFWTCGGCSFRMARGGHPLPWHHAEETANG